VPVFAHRVVMNGGYNSTAKKSEQADQVLKEIVESVAACNLNATMQNFMGITNSTVGRALLFPQQNTDIDLDMGEYEWLQIVANLTSGQNLQLAVSNANAATKAKAPWYNSSGQVVPPQAWQVIGDSGNGGTGIHF
jgi:predicted secreted protein